MKKVKIICSIIGVLLVVGLIVFGATHTYKDSHLRVDGIRVRVPEGSLYVSECDNGKSNAIYCEKTVKVKDKDVKFIFQYKNFKENGYPKNIVANVNGVDFYSEDNLNIEENGPSDYRIFLNFHVINDEYIAFTFTKGAGTRVTTLYIMDLDGNIVEQIEEVDNDDMRIRDNEEFIDYDDKTNSISIKATRLSNNLYHEKSICDASKNTVLEATYVYTLKNGKFIKKQTDKVTVSEYIKNNNISCTE